MMAALDQLSILILAGGRGSRMGGQDKGLVSLNERPMIDYLLDTLRPLSNDIIISCNRNEAAYAAFDHTIVSDGNSHFFGPLAGVLSGLQAARHSHLFVAPCDTPAITKRLVQRLHQTAQAYPQHIVMAHDGHRPQPLHAIIPTGLQQSLRETIAANRHSVMEWYAQHPLKTINCEDLPGDFANANRPEELSVLAATLRAASPTKSS